ncbi:hypothetical protein ACFU5O_18760 [Streptomyces sp. NPDC057445]|uniref:hypothetical protein n=1 Tax=Streptomyces sp. NPDC057445 TaxID=3346136 RepID=UPI0036CC10D9
MYLVHAHLELPSGAELPLYISELMRASIAPPDRVEHLAVHPRSPSRLTLGFYLLAGHLEEAEAHAVRVCRRLLCDVPQLRGARLLGAGVPLMPAVASPAASLD